jgi:hypothetical protein
MTLGSGQTFGDPKFCTGPSLVCQTAWGGRGGAGGGPVEGECHLL